MPKRSACYDRTPSEVDSIIARCRLTSAVEEVFEQARGATCDARDERRALAARIPPTVTRGEVPNRASVSSKGGAAQKEVLASEHVDLVLSDGKVLSVMKRIGPDGKVGFVDWVNFTIHEDTVQRMGTGGAITDDQVMFQMSYAMEKVFGYGITSKCERGRNFYRTSWVLGDGWGFVLHGGQRNTICVMVSGAGCAAAEAGWEGRLKRFLESSVKGKITRIDVAHDDFEGGYSPRFASEQYDVGLFRLPKAPQSPEWEGRGNWKVEESKKGITACIGLRTSGKYARIYEKGKQLGCSSSPWVRVEVEYKSVDRVIPFDVLTDPGCYLAGAYPALLWICEQSSQIKTVENKALCDKERKEEWITRQCGKDLWVLVELEDPDLEFAARAANVIRRLMVEEFPAWANVPDFRFSPLPIHEFDGSRVSGRHAETALEATLEI